jgi:hypothetical protein
VSLLVELAGEAFRRGHDLPAELCAKIVQVRVTVLVLDRGSLIGCQLVHLGSGDQALNLSHGPEASPEATRSRIGRRLKDHGQIEPTPSEPERRIELLTDALRGRSATALC